MPSGSRICRSDGDTVLPIVARIAAGDGPGLADPKGTAVRIFTGAPIPAGFDTVMMQEDCRERGRAWARWGAC